MIEVRNLVKRYGDHLAVDDLSFTVESGQIYGFLGPNGAGKSTTMNIITGYLGASSGHVIINGHDTLEEPEEAKRCIGYLPEFPPLYTDMTVMEYLAFAAELKGIKRAQKAQAILDVAERTGLDDVLDRLIANLSKGYKQRVGIAQAILGLPDIIILDEPTVGLDPKQIIEIRDLIKDLAREHTVILSSHILSEVQEICDHVLIIHHGKLIASGTPDELEQQMNSSSLTVTVKADDPEEIKALLSGIAGVSEVECSVSAAGEVTAVISTEDGQDLREEISYACAGARHAVLAMQASDMSLEQIFIELTAAADEEVYADEDNETEGGE